MGSKLIQVLAFILAVIIGVALANFWAMIRPADDLFTVIGVGIIGMIAAFTSLYFLTKGSGG